MASELPSKTALITGSTDGIGVDIARLFAAEGAEVVVSGRDRERGKAVVADITGAGGAARFVEAELTDVDSLRNLAAQAGDVDILVNNAVRYASAMALSQDVEGFDASFAVNVRAPYFLTAAIAQGMIARGGGVVVNPAFRRSRLVS